MPPRSAPPSRCRSTRAAASTPACGRRRSSSPRPAPPAKPPAARRAAEAEVATAARAVRTADAAIRALQRQVDSAGFALEGVRQEALVGARLVLDVLDAEQELFAAEVDLARARRERVVAGYRSLAASGRLTAADLKLAVPPVEDPAAHAREAAGRWFGLGDPVGED